MDVVCACQWAVEDCSAALLAHLGPQMMSLSIKIIGLDRKQESFDILFIQKYETNYYLGSRSCLLENAKGILLSSGINSPVIVHLFPLLIKQKQGFNQEGGINHKRNRAQRAPGARKHSSKECVLPGKRASACKVGL